MMKTDIGNAGRRYQYAEADRKVSIHTVTKDELGNASQNHRNASEEVVISTQTDRRLTWHGALESAEGEYGGRVRYQKPDQAEQRWISWRMESVSSSTRWVKTATHQTASQDHHDEALKAGRTTARTARGSTRQ
jgi:hypothetical protein